MLSWILIAFAIAVIFGVIKIDELKAWAVKVQPKLQRLFAEALKWAGAKTAEIKAAANKKNNTQDNRKDSGDSSAE